MADTSSIMSNSRASTVKGYHVNRAIEFYNKQDVYFALAKNEAWEENIPSPDYYDELQDVWGYKKVETRYLVVPDDESGTVSFQNHKFRIVSADEAQSQGARWLYLMSYINYDELPFETYHQIGIVTGLTVKEGTSSYAVLPENVVNPGVTEVINNRAGVSREADMREQISIVVEF